MNLACNVLAGMAATYRKLDVLAVRAVGTAALRDARNQPEFLARASTILGTPVEVISGLEEARLVHLGVQSQWPHPKQRLLVADIGGGSTELILSDAGHIVESFSKPLGAVRLTEMFLKSDPADPRELLRMRKYIQERVAGPVARFGPAQDRPHDCHFLHRRRRGLRRQPRAPLPARSGGPPARHGRADPPLVWPGERREPGRTPRESPASVPGARKSSSPA